MLLKTPVLSFATLNAYDSKGALRLITPTRTIAIYLLIPILKTAPVLFAEWRWHRRPPEAAMTIHVRGRTMLYVVTSCLNAVVVALLGCLGIRGRWWRRIVSPMSATSKRKGNQQNAHCHNFLHNVPR
jgi:hypothetical protein